MDSMDYTESNAIVSLCYSYKIEWVVKKTVVEIGKLWNLVNNVNRIVNIDFFYEKIEFVSKCMKHAGAMFYVYNNNTNRHYK